VSLCVLVKVAGNIKFMVFFAKCLSGFCGCDCGEGNSSQKPALTCGTSLGLV
jgi:hypothetical protein